MELLYQALAIRARTRANYYPIATATLDAIVLKSLGR
jgi:hypothetical protein